MSLAHILLATDFSPPADDALARAIALARREGARLTLLHADAAMDTSPALATVESSAAVEIAAVASEVSAANEQALAARVAQAVAAGVPTESMHRFGHPDEVVAAVATELGADLVVAGTHGRTGIKRFLLGSSAEHIVRLAPTSVLIARGQVDPGSAEFAKALVATDFSPACEKALRLAISLTAAGATIDIIHAWQYPPGSWGLGALGDRTGAMKTLHDALTLGASQRGAELVERFGGHGRTVRFRLEQGPAASVIHDVAEAEGHDLIALGTHAHRGFRRLLLGSVAEATVRHAPCSVLVAHAGAAPVPAGGS